MSRYCNAQDVRTYTGLKIVDAPDLELEEFLDPATRALIDQITVTRDWERMSASSADDTVFYTEKYPIADIDGDGTVDKNDVVVYYWEDLDDAETKTLLTVSTVTASEGKIKLSSAPPDDAEAVTCNYRYYPNEIDSILLKQATALYAGYLYAFTKWIWIPDGYTLGPLRIRNVVPVWDKIYKQYVRVLALLQRRQYAIREPWIDKGLVDMDKRWR